MPPPHAASTLPRTDACTLSTADPIDPEHAATAARPTDSGAAAGSGSVSRDKLDPGPADSPAPGSEEALDPDQALSELDQELNRLQRMIRLSIQAKLVQLAGRSLGSLEMNQEFVRRVHELLESHGLRVRCTECGHPAILRVSPRKGAAAGAFVFDHKVDGKRTFHGGAGMMPLIHLVAKPPRQRPGAAKPAEKRA